MYKFALPILALLAISISDAAGQSPAQPTPQTVSTDAEKLQLLSELQALNAQSDRLATPLARARAKAEIASALWHLDVEEAKRMLTRAYELTLPEEAEREKSRAKAVGADMDFPSETERARTEVRGRILQVAGRDRAYAAQLIKLGADSLGHYEAHMSNALLARQALLGGDTKAAGGYIIDAVEAEPTQTLAGPLIHEIAKKDRAAADALIVQYIDRLRSIPLTFSQSSQRVFFVLLRLVFPETFAADQQVPPPGPAVMRAYASYVIQSMGQVAQREPGNLVRVRSVLLTAGPPVREHAPELMPAYLELERLSRGGADGNPFQTPGEISGPARANRERQLDAALGKDTIDASLIEPALRRGMFDKARRAAETLPDGDRRTQLIDLINVREAASLLATGEVAAAERLAERLRTAPRILETYSALVNRCGKDQACKIPLLSKALSQMKAAEATLPPVPENAPAAILTTRKESDTRLSSLGKLASMAVSVDDDLARAALAEVVTAINRTTVASDLGRMGFDVELFGLCAQKDEGYAQASAAGLTDPLRRIAALSAIDEWKAKQVKEKEAGQRALKKAKSTVSQP